MKNPLQLKLKTEILPIFLLFILIIISFYFYTHFPEKVVTHWNINGIPDGYSSRLQASFFILIIIFFIYISFLFLPLIDPHKEEYRKFVKVYNIFKLLILIFLVLVYFLVGLNNLGLKISKDFFLPIIIGLMFIIIGKYLPALKTNWFFGIRTPWTLSNKKVWIKTHILSGKSFIFAGTLMLFFPFLNLFLKKFF